MNNTTFDFQKDHPELYAQVQRDKTLERRVTVRAFLTTLIVNIMVLGMLSRDDVSFGTTIFILAILSFTVSFTSHLMIKRWMK